MLFRSRKELLPLALAATAWAFFLFSFQVHEKSVLLPLMPMTLILASKNGMHPYTRSWVGFANILGAWTMFPLLQRVELRVPYAVLTLLWAYLLDIPPVSWGVYRKPGWGEGILEQGYSRHTYVILPCYDSMAWPRSICGHAQGSTRSVGGD